MQRTRTLLWLTAPCAILFAGGCAVSNVSFSGIQRPDRATALDAYDVFVGTWTWEATMLNADSDDASWSGQAAWNWTLDKRCLHGEMSAKSNNADFKAEGIWSWHPKARKYIWSMFNNWGYPQEGTAHYDDDTKCWRMAYRSVGLDGTTSYGRYEMKVVDNNTLEWSASEWADALHMIKKMEMEGTYKRQR